MTQPPHALQQTRPSRSGWALAVIGVSHGIRRQMNMKLRTTVIVLLAAVATARAVFILPFTSWDDLAKKSPDIVIARCATTPEPLGISDGMIWSDIEVLSVLKGDIKPGAARMVSQYWPRQGERFLMFATYQSNQLYRAYNATETYRIVPLSRYFLTNELAGKPLDEQIQLVLRHRLDDVTTELKSGADEKRRLEETANTNIALSVEVSPVETNYSLARHGRAKQEQNDPNAFLIHFRVSNPSNVPCAIGVMTCSYWQHWQTDNEKVSVKVWGCDHNGLNGISLNSTNVYSGDVPIIVRPDSKPGQLSFRMAFTPGTNRGTDNFSIAQTNWAEGTFWSDEIKIRVVP